MRNLTATILLLTVVSLEADAASRRRAAPAPVDPDAVTISFTQVDGAPQTTDATIDVGSVANRGHEKSARHTERIAVRVDRKNGIAGGTASLRAFLETSDGRAVIRVDGIVLGSAPILIDAHAPIGAAIAHRIEIEVAPSVSPGDLATSIGWEVTTN